MITSLSQLELALYRYIQCTKQFPLQVRNFIPFLTNYQGKDWKEYVLNIEDFVGYSNSRTFNKFINPKKIKLLGIEAYGRDHEVELDIAKIKIF